MVESRSRIRTKILTEITVFSALSAVLYTIRPYTLPFGGSITLGSMVPVMWLSMRRGVRVGCIAGAIFGGLAWFIDVMTLGAANIIVTPVQVILEYPIAFGVLGFAAIFHKKTVGFAIAGVALSVSVKFFIHYFVGVFVWSTVYAFPAEYGLYLWPAVYNGSFLLPEFIISAIIISVLIKTKALEYGL